MLSILRSLPAALTTYRLLLGPAAILGAWYHAPVGIYAVILITGILSDIFDGVIARKLGVATVLLRRYDSTVDLVFYLCILGTATLLHPTAIREHLPAILVILGSELMCILVSLIRFQCMPGTHSYLAKFYGIVLFTCFFLLLVWGISDVIFAVAAGVAVITNGEVVLILLLSPVAPVDITSFTHVLRRAP
jgi:CDP-diacylglycerol--glycerol-3-phosphate 3-phosphatidyltransferase